MRRIEGRAWVFGDHINTDLILPGRYLKLTYQQAAAHVMEGIDPDFPHKVRAGDIVVGGVNFGCGSSRESAPAALKAAGVAAIVARSFGRIFFRNAINLGLPVVECGNLEHTQSGDWIGIDLQGGKVSNTSRGEQYRATVLPRHLVELLTAGGLVAHLEDQIRSGRLKGKPGPNPVVAAE